jgi:plastocyanin
MALRLLFITSLLTATLLAATSCGGDAGQQSSNSSGNGSTTSMTSTTEAPEESSSVLESTTTKAGGKFKDQEKAGKAEKGNGKARGVGRSGGNKVKTVKMLGLKYVPATVHISAGTTIRWVNEDTAKHTVSSDPSSGPLQSGEFGKGGSYEHTFEKPGSFDYYCKVHPFMTGTVIVR